MRAYVLLKSFILGNNTRPFTHEPGNAYTVSK